MSLHNKLQNVMWIYHVLILAIRTTHFCDHHIFTCMCLFKVFCIPNRTGSWWSLATETPSQSLGLLVVCLNFKIYIPHHNHFTLLYSWNCLYYPLLSSLFSQIFFLHHRNLALSYQMNLGLLMLEFLCKKEKEIHWNLTEHKKYIK